MKLQGELTPGQCTACGSAILNVTAADGKQYCLDVSYAILFVLAEVDNQVVVRPAPQQIYLDHDKWCGAVQAVRNLKKIMKDGGRWSGLTFKR